VVTEYWLPADGTMLLGVSQTIVSGETREYEFLSITRVGEAWEYVARPSGQQTTAFRATSAGTQQITFENRAHDFPQVIAYRRHGDALAARISGAVNGKERAIDFSYSRCPAR
jgi:hypothetical protein